VEGNKKRAVIGWPVRFCCLCLLPIPALGIQVIRGKVRSPKFLPWLNLSVITKTLQGGARCSRDGHHFLKRHPGCFQRYFTSGTQAGCILAEITFRSRMTPTTYQTAIHDTVYKCLSIHWIFLHVTTCTRSCLDSDHSKRQLNRLVPSLSGLYALLVTHNRRPTAPIRGAHGILGLKPTHPHKVTLAIKSGS